MSEDRLIDVDEVAARVLASPEAIYTLTPVEAVALAGFIQRARTDHPTPLWAPPVDRWPVPASLAVALAKTVRALNDYQAVPPDDDGADPAMDALLVALQTLETRFEEEFPHAR